MRESVRWALTAVLSFTLASCGGGGGGSSGGGTTAPPTTPAPANTLYPLPAPESLSVTDVQKIIAQAVAEANARNTPAVIAVTDRVGNVLAVYSMFGSRIVTKTRRGPNGDLDAQGIDVASTAAAIAKAITGAYLSSSGGNAFSSRTASQIVQQHFPPAPVAVGLESGPLSGVQFSSLPCSDVVQRGAGLAGPGPRRSPLGLSADPGGFPLYKNGVLVGGVGIAADGDYGFDTNIQDVDEDVDENIAWAATFGFQAPAEIRADRIAVDGTTLRFSDASDATLKSSPAGATPFNSLTSTTGRLVPVNGYYTGAQVLPGTIYGTEASGLRLATAAEFSNPNAMVLSDGAGQNRFPIRDGTDANEVGTPLTAAEVRAILEEAFIIMSRARGQIRRPLDSRAQVSISVVDSRGQILGIVRAPDAPVFGIDVSVQKARTVSFFSNPNAAFDLLGSPSSDVRNFVQRVRDFIPDQTALTGKTAFGNRAIGNLHRPYFPDGQVGNPPGPLSRSIAQWSPLSTGLQSALIIDNVAQHLGFINGAPTDTPARCTSIRAAATNQNRLQNGLQIFSGGVPIYRGSKQVGGIGISGDGIDQDDMVAFLGLYNAAQRVTTINEADPSIRSDTLLVGPETKGRLRYVNCPFAPFLDTDEQNVCQGK